MRFRTRPRWAVALVLMLGALAVVAAAGALLAWLTPAPPPPVRNPFGVGVREGGGAASGIAGWILAEQAQFYKSLTAALRAAGQTGAAAWTLLGLSFAYGAFHAAGPGHGKAVIAGWIVAQEKALIRGICLALAAAALQAVVAIALVGILGGIVAVTAAKMTAATAWVEWASFAAMAAIGSALLARKAWTWAGRIIGDAAPGCDHVHMPEPAATASWTAAAGAVLAAGLRPCSGAIIVLVFSLSLGLLPLGIGAVLVMAAGTGLTTAALAAMAVLFKHMALRLASGRGRAGTVLLAGAELVAAALVALLGLALMLGLSAAGTG